MNPTLETIKKGQELFDTKFGELDLDPESRGLCNDIKRWHTSFLISLFEGEVERHNRLKKERKPTHGTCCTCQTCGFDYDSCECGNNRFHDQEIKHYQEIIDYLKSIV